MGGGVVATHLTANIDTAEREGGGREGGREGKRKGGREEGRVEGREGGREI